MRGTIRERFEGKIERIPWSGCWIWTGYCLPNGYPRIGGGIKENAKYAHRISYELFIGPIPKGKFICHKCDVRSCVNPNHLYAGTHIENMRDMQSRGRKVIQFGIDASNAKLTEKQVLEIHGSTLVSRVLAKRYKISRSQVQWIKREKTWRHLFTNDLTIDE